MKRALVSVLIASLLAVHPARAQFGVPGGQMRIVLLVDSSNSVSPMLIQFRAALNGFLDTLPGEPEIAFISTGGQLRVRVAPTTDRAALYAAANRFAADGGGNTLLDTMLEADQRFFKKAPDRRAVFVILTTDSDVVLRDARTDLYNKFMGDFLSRGGRAHAIVIGGGVTGINTLITENLVRNTGGFYETVTIANSVPKLMKTLADYVAADQ